MKGPDAARFGADDYVTWAMAALCDAADQPGHGFRWPVVASVGEDGAPQARMLVLREARREPPGVVFFTDARSAKVTQWQRAPRAALTCYAPEARVQLRASAQVTVHQNDAVTLHHFAQLKTHHTVEYRGVLAPGSIIGDPALLDHQDEAHFAVVAMALLSLDILHLAEAGHRRVQAHWRVDGWSACFVAP